MIIRDDDIRRERDEDLAAVMLAGDLVDEMIRDCVAGIDGDRICPICGGLVVGGVCEDVGGQGCRWTVEMGGVDA